MATYCPDHELAYALAVDLCSQWKHQNRKSVLSVDDLMKIKVWINTAGNGVIKYPAMAPLATQGLDQYDRGKFSDRSSRGQSIENLDLFG